MSTRLTRLFRKLSSKDREKVKEYIEDPLTFFIDEYESLSSVDKSKFHKFIGVHKGTSTSKKSVTADVDKVSSPQGASTTSSDTSTEAPSKDSATSDVTSLKEQIESMDLEGEHKSDKEVATTPPSDDAPDAEEEEPEKDAEEEDDE